MLGQLFRKRRANELCRQANSLIGRYSYVVGESSSRFLSMKAPASTARMLDSLTSDHPAFVAINDDITTDVASVDRTLEEWFQKTWPEPTQWELGNDGEVSTA